MVYMSGDNNLEGYISSDLETELAVPGSSANVQITALADRGPGYDKSHGDWQSTKLFHVTPGMTALPASAVADWGERDMGNPQTLVDFVSWSKTNYPADHYALYFWGHGWSWHPGVVMQDDTNAGSLDYHEMKPIMNTLGFIDVVGYDGCNMASIEIQSLWHGHATALAASQEWVGWDGIEYDVVLNQLNANPYMTADQVGVATAPSAVNEKTFSAVAVDGRWDALRTAVDNFGIAMKNGASANRQAMTRRSTPRRACGRPRSTRTCTTWPSRSTAGQRREHQVESPSGDDGDGSGGALRAARQPVRRRARHHDLPHLQGVRQDDLMGQLVLLPEHRLGGPDPVG